MLPERDIDKLCYGRLVYAELYDSAEKDAAGVHWAVMLDATEDIKKNDIFYVVAISNNTDIDDRFIVPVPPRTGRKGHVVCSWRPIVHLAGIEKLGMVLLDPEMRPIQDMIRRHKEHQAQERSTQG